jgi:hypothetical protein
VLAQQPKPAGGRSVEQQPELVGQKAMAAQAVGLKLQLQLLDAVFHGAPQPVNAVIDKLRVAAHVSDYSALVGARMGLIQLGDDPAGPDPEPRLRRCWLNGYSMLADTLSCFILVQCQWTMS